MCPSNYWPKERVMRVYLAETFSTPRPHHAPTSNATLKMVERQLTTPYIKIFAWTLVSYLLAEKNRYHTHGSALSHPCHAV